MTTVDTDAEEQIAFLHRLTGSPDPAKVEQARAALYKWGFDPSEPRTATGEWTTQSSTTETSTRRNRRRRKVEAKDRAENAAQLAALDETDRTAAQAAEDERRRHPARRPKHGPLSPVAAARRQYGIPANIDQMGGKKGQAGRDLLAATAELARIARRRTVLQAHLKHLQEQLSQDGLGGRTRQTLTRRQQAAQQRLTELGARERTAQADLADARRRWGKGTKKGTKKGATPDLTKAGVVDARGRLHVQAGSREGGRFAKMDLGDVLGLKDQQHSAEMRFHASHRIGGRNQNPVIATIDEWDHQDDYPIGISVGTSHKYKPGSTDYSGHATADLDPAGARHAADHLRDLVAIGRSGHKAGPKPKPTDHSRTAEKIRHMAENGNIDLTDNVRVGDDDDQLAISYKDLLDLLAPHVPAPTVDEKRMRRTVKRVEHPEGTDAGDLHMLLDTAGEQPVIHFTSRERGTGPWDPHAEPYPGDPDDPALWTAQETSQLGLDDAEELADVLDRYARGVEELSAQEQARREKWNKTADRVHELQAAGQGHRVALRTRDDGSQVVVIDGEEVEE